MRISVTRRPERLNDIKKQAEKVITNRYPEWKQRNMLASAQFIIQKIALGETLSEEEMAEQQSLNAAWAWIQSVRAYSDSLEAQIIQGLQIDITAGWPE